MRKTGRKPAHQPADSRANKSMNSIKRAQSGTFRTAAVAVLLWLICFAAVRTFGETGDGDVFVAVFDFSPQSEDAAALADAVRLKLARQDGRWKVIDTQSMRELAISSPDMNSTAMSLRTLLQEQVAAHACIFGELKKAGNKYVADVRIFNTLTNPQTVVKNTFSDETERWRGNIAQKIIQAFIGRQTEQPPQAGDEQFPSADRLTGPINANPSFELAGHGGWESPDNVASFIVERPDNSGKMLLIRTDVDREQWLAYRKALSAGEASVDSPPQITSGKNDTIAGQEGVHFKSDFIPADTNATYWLKASCRFIQPSNPRASATSKVFIKGFRKIPLANINGLPESTLKKLKMTPAD
ncbi:MAG TPA: hypothetical protein PKK48_07720, partial [Phycisphaerae bacterium]|nr:hypothetical protein [Phycisphaerae bacterium]